jgi:hypothetical protein
MSLSPLSLNATVAVLISIATHCQQHCRVFAIDVSLWLLSPLDNCNGPNESLPRNRLNGQYFFALGLFIRSIASPTAISNVDIKYSSICSLVAHALSPLQTFSHHWRSAEEGEGTHCSVARVGLCGSQRSEIFLSLARLTGVVKSMSGDDIFTNFFGNIDSTLFDALNCVTESYVWLDSRLNNINTCGVDAFVSTSLCHIGELGPPSSQAVRSGDFKCLSYLSDLHNTLVTCLIAYYDLTGPSQDSFQSMSKTLYATKGVLSQVQSSRLIDFVAVLIRWGSIDGHKTSVDSPGNTLPETQYQLVRHCLAFSVAKLSDIALFPRKSSLSWLSAEIDSCLRLCRQVAVSSFSLLVVALDERREEEEKAERGGEEGQYASSITCELFNLMDLTITTWSVCAGGELCAQPRSISSILQQFVHHRDSFIENISFYHAWQQHLADLVANIFIGLCYGPFVSKLRAWSEIVHSLMSLVLSQPQDRSMDGQYSQFLLSQRLGQLVHFLGERLVRSQFALTSWLSVLERQGIHRPDPHQGHGVVCLGNGECLFLTQEAAQEQFEGTFMPPQSTFRIDNKKTTLSICQKIVNKFRIDLSQD